MDWALVSRNEHETLEVAEVPGGRLLRFWERSGSDAAAPLLSVVFVPGDWPPPAVTDTPAVLVNGEIATTATVGDALTCTQGNWQGVPSGYTYTWRANEGPVSSLQGNTLLVTPELVGKLVDCVVTAASPGGSTEALPSNAVEIVA